MSALIPSHSADNRVIEAALNVIYYKKVVFGTWIGTSVVTSSASVTYSYMHEYHRVARKSYKYVGMTKAGADACVTAMKSIYTRSVKYQRWKATAGTFGDWEDLLTRGSEISTEIVARNVAGEMWEVTVNVNEDSIYMSKTDAPRSYATIFSEERQRGYDGETEV